jgi:uncharacterized protein
MHLSRYLKIFPDPGDPGRVILFSTRRCSVLSVPKDTLKRIEEGNLPEAELNTLVKNGILVPDPAKEREEMVTRFDRVNERGRRFDAIVLLTLECNLACGYCFEEGVRGSGAMSPDTAGLLVEWIEREQIARGRKVSIDFYGGEPLMALDLIRSISARLRESSEANGLPFEFHLVTNGTLLTRPVAQELKELGLGVAKFTLDGPAEIHDRSRPFVSGRGSFQTIAGNILETMDLTRVQIGGNFTRDNYREFPKLLGALLEMGIDPKKLDAVQFSPVTGRVGGSPIPDYKNVCTCTGEEWLGEATLFLREEILKRGFPTPRPGPAGCMIEFANSMVVNVDGAIYRCPVFVGREGFAIGSLQGGMGDSSVYGPGIWKREECLECPWLPLCFGGCRFMSYLKDGDMNGVDCWKGLLEATMEKSVLQDLKYRPKNKNAPRSEEREARQTADP